MGNYEQFSAYESGAQTDHRPIRANTFPFYMKYPIAACFTLFLAACGGQQSDQTMQTAFTQSSSAQQVRSKAIASLPGERRSYDIIWSEKTTLTGKSKVPLLPDFRLSAPEMRLQDISLTYNTDGSAGQLYRLYKAAFGRTPDVRGFGYWKDTIENHGFTLDQVASAFLESLESRTVYGTSSDDSTFVARLYQNVLGRGPDAAGVTYWADALRTGMKRVNALLAFSESAENKAATAASTLGGMPFAEPATAYIPVSNASGPTDVSVGVTFEVDGIASTDANDDKLNYTWSVTTKPSSSIAAFATANVVRPRISLDIPGTYQLTLWASDGSSRSYSPALLTVVAHGIVADSGTYTCSGVDANRAAALYSLGHTYLDRNKDGQPCNAADIAYEKAPPVAAVPDIGTFKCSTISHEYAVLLYLQGHSYLDRDHDGKPCESTDITIENTKYTPPVSPPANSGMCYVNGYTRKNGTHVSGYWRHC
jgi:hypothetical protein